MAITRITLTYKQSRIVEDYLDTVLSNDKVDDTLFIYGVEFDDATVADKMDFACSPQSVKRIRLEMFGPLVQPEKSHKKSIVTEQLQALHKRVTILEKVMLQEQ